MFDYAVDARPIIIDGKPSDWLVKYQTEQEYKPLHRHDSTTININAVNGTSVIGSQENVVLNMGNSLSDIEQLIRSLPQQDQSCAQELLNELSAMESCTLSVILLFPVHPLLKYLQNERVL